VFDKNGVEAYRKELVRLINPLYNDESVTPDQSVLTLDPFEELRNQIKSLFF
jgi:hypothetical protein